MLGDSITAQAFNTNYKAWPQFGLDQIQRSIAEPVYFVNAGVAGELVSEVAVRAPAALATNPSIVVVLAGANDLGQGDVVTLEDSIAAYTSIGNQLQAGGVQFIFCTNIPRALSGTQTAEQIRVRLVQMNDWLRANVGTWPNATLCDWAYALSDGGDGETWSNVFLEDGLHLSEAGARVAGDEFAPALASVLITL
jgi:lysophospholipase L1-like esterase